MKFGQLIEYPKRNISIQKSCSKWGKETSFRLFFFFKKKVLYEVKASGRYILIALNLAYNKNKF